MKFFYTNVLILLLIKHAAGEFEYIPPSREIEVIEESDYTFGIVEDDTTNITRCYYTTDTEISGYFDVYKEAPKPTTTTAEGLLVEDQLEYNSQYENFNQSHNNQEVRVVPNEITHSGNVGLCKMKIKWADGKGPTKWTLTPYDNQTNGHEGNLPPITYTINFFYKPPLFKKDINMIYETESFFQYLNVTNINFPSCKLSFNDTTIELAPDSTRTNAFSTPNSHKSEIMNNYTKSLQFNSKSAEETIKRISYFGHGLCGFKLEGATPADSLQWTISATDDQKRRYKASFKSYIIPKIASSVLNTKHSVVVGENYILSCGDRFLHKFCILYNPSGRLMFTESSLYCAYTIPTVGMDDIGVWKCITGNEYGMEPITYSVELIAIIKAKAVETWVNETDSTFNIGCRLSNYYSKSGISFCKLTAPNQQPLIILPGIATDRYLSFGTNMQYGICAVQISKPLQEFENGMWLCEIFIGATSIGDFINVGQTELPDYPKHLSVTLQLEQLYKIQCQVPYSSEYCHIKAPNGTVYPSDSEDEARSGKCSLKLGHVNAVDNGTWTCSFARGTGAPDEEILLEITIAEVFQFYRAAEVDVGKTAQLMCRSGGLPFKYCRFIAPNGKAYHITNHQTSNTISYYGKGFEYGECGITIANAQISDSGYWTCVTRIGSNFKQSEITAEIMLEVIPRLFDDPNIAAAVGIAVGVVVVSSILAVVALQKWRRRRHAEVPGSTTVQHRIINDDDNNSETIDIFNVTPTPHSYTNPESDRVELHANAL